MLSTRDQVSQIEIRAESPDQPEVRALLADSDAYVASLYPAESNHMLDIGALTGPAVTFLVARADGRVVGCGAVVTSAEGWVESKRMFVSLAARSHGVGRQLLRQLEALARQGGATTLRLETGVRQPEALALYRSAGFVEIGPFWRLWPRSAERVHGEDTAGGDPLSAGTATAEAGGRTWRDGHR